VLTDEVRATVNYRPLEAALQPAPWYSGRVVLVGDAAHATTPHLAFGAGMAVEDGVVLAQEVERGGEVAAILERHVQRRYERCRTVVDSSLRLGEIEMTRGSAVEHADITARAMAALAQPI
jgi:2-polyprenyl-6-methoxyphenol hydroxylase-like FAD-dependent oxidoreductase